ncbi:MAG TPA: hypothetical protein VKU44_12445 [Terriglobia bacterium]|nr:hypothetical protein [Terriglobia bacterium]
MQNHTEYTPRRPRSSDQAFRGDFSATPQQISLKNRKIPTDYLEHAHKHLGKIGMELIRERYSLDVCLPRMLHLYEDACAGRKQV